eukprot:2639536-Rhodomonas_salina.1
MLCKLLHRLGPSFLCLVPHVLCQDRTLQSLRCSDRTVATQCMLRTLADCSQHQTQPLVLRVAQPSHRQIALSAMFTSGVAYAYIAYLHFLVFDLHLARSLRRWGRACYAISVPDIA